MRRHFLLIAAVALAALGGWWYGKSSRPEPVQPRPAAAVTRASQGPGVADWAGVYATPKEVGGFTATALSLRCRGERMDYVMSFRSDYVGADAIQQDELKGSFLVEGNQLYLPRAVGFIREGKVDFLALAERYTRMEINGHMVLMRDDALRSYREENKLYDYGILIRVKTENELFYDLTGVEHPSIKLLYRDPEKPWRDPFVHGANER